ncbi:MAG: DNA polymerase/3'-5' exonuclease PolX [Phycisphaerales bacterium]|nr:DNA polymerase/3'-5' exonuclease PolX [Phycisphaerales bacterium]
MSSNRDLADRFLEAAAIMEITGANGFRVNAVTKVARILEDLPTEIAPMADDLKALQAIDGIGKSSAEKIKEFVETGTIKDFDALRESIPPGLIEVLDVPGLGPKTVKVLWEKGDVVDVESLKAKIDSGELEGIPRMGAKTLANIRDAIDFSERSAGRMRLGEALPLADALVARLSNARGVTRIAYAGSLRRGRETIGDIDILVASTTPESPTAALTKMPGVEKVLLSGETKTSVRLESGVQVDLRIVPESTFGAALLYFTGSKEHNVMLREIAIAKSMRLNEYGLFPDDGAEEPPQKRGIEPVASASEQDIYDALDIRFLPPELREDRNPVDWSVPEDLVTVKAIKAELHCHTDASDGVMTLDELIEQARKRDFHTLAVTDHSRSSVQANGLSVDRLLAQIDEIHEANERYEDITVLAGSEVDILADGRLDYDDEILARLDWVVASPHTSLRQDPAKATARLVKAIEHPLVHVLGHPTGRLINEREGLSPDMAELIAAAKAHDTALELNANPWRLDLRDKHVRLASTEGALVTIDTDAHRPADFDLLKYGILTARRGGLTTGLCPNCWDRERLRAWIDSKRT